MTAGSVLVGIIIVILIASIIVSVIYCIDFFTHDNDGAGTALIIVAGVSVIILLFVAIGRNKVSECVDKTCEPVSDCVGRSCQATAECIGEQCDKISEHLNRSRREAEEEEMLQVMGSVNRDLSIVAAHASRPSAVSQLFPEHDQSSSRPSASVTGQFDNDL